MWTVSIVNLLFDIAVLAILGYAAFRIFKFAKKKFSKSISK